MENRRFKKEVKIRITEKIYKRLNEIKNLRQFGSVTALIREYTLNGLQQDEQSNLVRHEKETPPDVKAQ